MRILSKISCGKDKERKNYNDCKFQKRISWINELSVRNIYNDPDNAMFNFFVNDLFFFSFHSRIVYWKKNIKCSWDSWDICFAKLLIHCKYELNCLQILEFTELKRIKCCKFWSMYGFNHEKYCKKIVCS